MGVAQENALEKMIDACSLVGCALSWGMGPPRPGCRTDTALVPGRRVCLYDYEYVLLWEKLEPVQLRLVGDLLWDGARPYLEDGSQEEARLVPCGTRLISFPRRTFGSASGSVA